MNAAHCFKKVAQVVEAEKEMTVRELVTRYGDDWATMAALSKAGWAMRRSRMADQTTDRNEFFLMRRFERGEQCRCGEEA